MNSYLFDVSMDSGKLISMNVQLSNQDEQFVKVVSEFVSEFIDNFNKHHIVQFNDTCLIDYVTKNHPQQLNCTTQMLNDIHNEDIEFRFKLNDNKVLFVIAID